MSSRKILSFFFFLLLFSFVNGTENGELFEDERIVHECGVALVRLMKPLSYYAEAYKDPAWGVKKLMMLMEKQRNRGQDGAGIAVIKKNMPSGEEYLYRLRSTASNAIDTIFEQVIGDIRKLNFKVDTPIDEIEWKKSSNVIGEVYLGHLRYATHSGIDIKFCQPFTRSHGVPCRHFALAGNFNMTNTKELISHLEQWGIFPTSSADTQVIIETIAYHLDREYEQREREFLHTPWNDAYTRASIISDQIDLASVLKNAAKSWDGGYLFCGILGNGDAFVCRDPAGIRPGYYIANEEVVAVASEKIALLDSFPVSEEEIMPIKPGSVLVITHKGEIIESSFTQTLVEKQCMFERIYFSKGNDPQIYKERIALGRNVAKEVYDAIEGDLAHTIFSYVPNSSLGAFQGLIEEMAKLANQNALQGIFHSKETNMLSYEELEKYVKLQPRVEYLISKNQRIRTFISGEQTRKTLVAQLYEITKGIVTPEDTLVVIDDSIVRGVTLKESLIKKLIELHPKKIIIVSSAPPIYYPDCYGIDMSQLGNFIAFQAAISLVKEHHLDEVLENIKNLSITQKDLPASEVQNVVKEIYNLFSEKQIINRIAELVTPTDVKWDGKVEIIYQSLKGLHDAIPNFKGDWYFSGEYPTPGGYKMLNTSYLNWCEGKDIRSY